MEHALRDYARGRFETAIGPGPTSRNVERSVYNWAVQTTRNSGEGSSWENRAFRMRYKQKVLGLLAELTRAPVIDTALEVRDGRVTVTLTPVPQLVRRIRRRELEAKSLARYSADVLWPEGPMATAYLKLKKRDMAIEATKALDEDYSGMFTCRRCKSKKTTFYLLQTRSADEPMTAYITCIACGNKWKG